MKRVRTITFNYNQSDLKIVNKSKRVSCCKTTLTNRDKKKDTVTKGEVKNNKKERWIKLKLNKKKKIGELLLNFKYINSWRKKNYIVNHGIYRVIHDEITVGCLKMHNTKVKVNKVNFCERLKRKLKKKLDTQ